MQTIRKIRSLDEISPCLLFHMLLQTHRISWDRGRAGISFSKLETDVKNHLPIRATSFLKITRWVFWLDRVSGLHCSPRILLKGNRASRAENSLTILCKMVYRLLELEISLRMIWRISRVYERVVEYRTVVSFCMSVKRNIYAA